MQTIHATYSKKYYVIFCYFLLCIHRIGSIKKIINFLAHVVLFLSAPTVLFLTDLTYKQVLSKLHADDTCDKVPHFNTVGRIIRRLKRNGLLPTLKGMKYCTLLQAHSYYGQRDINSI